ncbi:hypothetical protein CACC_01430 [Corynebacterium accolens]|nr:hypothetical protein CACC_01430 [Corynebacterium accolens]
METAKHTEINTAISDVAALRACATLCRIRTISPSNCSTPISNT